MTDSENVNLDSLVGEHVLDGVDTYVERIKKEWTDYEEDANVIRFRLDGTVYVAFEDASNGYRSSMERLIVSPSSEMTNVFPGVRVLARMKDAGPYGQQNDTLQLLDMVTGKIVMEVGTDNTDDYYPLFVSYFDPENMATNQTAHPMMSVNKEA